MNALLVLSLGSVPAFAEEPDHEIHEELRAVLHDAMEAVNGGRFEEVLPLLTEDFEGTTITQAVVTGRPGVTAFFDEWFGASGYMKTMNMTLEADALTDLSADGSWGLVRGKGLEHYEANNGDEFDFVTRWTAVMIRSDDGRWRVRAVHFGTNHLDNPVLTKVSSTLIRYGVIGSVVAFLAGIGLGWLVGRRQRPASSAASRSGSSFQAK